MLIISIIAIAIVFIIALLLASRHFADTSPSIIGGGYDEKMKAAQDVPYSMNFTGADRLDIEQIDYEEEGEPKREKRITDPATIARIIELLASLPNGGELMAKMGPVRVHTIVAYRQDIPFAKVSFYGSMLKTENTAFLGLGSEDPISVREAELFSLIEIR